MVDSSSGCIYCEGLVTSYSHGQTKGVHSWKAIISFYFETEEKRLQSVRMTILSGWFSMNT